MDGFVFLPSKEQIGESAENFNGQMIGPAKNWSINDENTTLIMLDSETQIQTLKETVTPIIALEIAIHIEMGAQKHKKLN